MKTDYHCHILPGIDDGAKDIEESVFLAQKLVEWGFERAICTPHSSYILNTVNLKANSERNGAFSGDSSTNSKSFEGKVHLHRSSLSDSKDVAKVRNNLETLANFLEKVSKDMNNSTSIYEFPNAKGIVVSGDIHGDYTQLVFKACVSKKMTDTLIVVAGDCGFGFQKPGYYENIYSKCRERLAKANNWLVFVRGNHDNPAYFDGKQVNYERWKAVPDYSVLKACGHTILCVGGAVTMERTWRESSEYHHFHPTNPLQPDLYWSAEVPVYDQAMLDTVTEACAVDTVITHTAPSFCEPKEKRTLEQWTAEDPLLPADVKRERETIDRIFDYLKENDHPLQHWFYGHFHRSWHSEIEGVHYQLLDTMQIKKLAPDDDIFNKQSEKEYKEKLDELAKLAAMFPVF